MVKKQRPKTFWTKARKKQFFEFRTALIHISVTAEGISPDGIDYRNCFASMKSRALKVLEEKCEACGK
jgi:hypothetical protein